MTEKAKKRSSIIPTKPHLPEFVGYDKVKENYKWRCKLCKKEWREQPDHSCILKNSTLYDGYNFLCIPDIEPWWFKSLNQTELNALKELNYKKIEKFVTIMNKLRRSQTKFSGPRCPVDKYKEIPVLNRRKLVIITPMDIILKL
jgi:hypothetical protein